MPTSPLVQTALDGGLAPPANGHANGSAKAEQKERGGYYTPDAIASVLAEWAITHAEAQVLEPSAGDGQFVVAASRRMGGSGHVTAVELYSEEATKIAVRTDVNSTVVIGDFFR